MSKWGVMIAIAILPLWADELDRFIGEWHGESVCVAKDTACRDETVVYRITKKSGHASVSADKIVNGNAINMGTLEFQYDHDSLICEYSQGVWRLKVDGGKIEGTLILPDHTVFRRVTLRKEP
jgi:hypothetical protein